MGDGLALGAPRQTATSPPDKLERENTPGRQRSVASTCEVAFNFKMWHRSHRSHRSHDQLICVNLDCSFCYFCVLFNSGLFPATLVLHLLRGGGGGGGWLARGLTRLPNGVSECIVGKRSLVFRSPTPLQSDGGTIGRTTERRRRRATKPK